MSISPWAIGVTDTYNPDTGIGMVFNGKLHTLPRMAVDGMMSSASQISCVGVAMVQCRHCAPLKYVEHIIF